MSSNNDDRDSTSQRRSSTSEDSSLESKLNAALNILEPTPFRDGTAFISSPHLPGRYAVGSLSTSAAASPPSVPTNQAARLLAQQHNEQAPADRIQTSWMATVDRVINKRPQERDAASNSKGDDESSIQALNQAPIPFQQSQGKKRARLDQQLVVDSTSRTDHDHEGEAGRTKSRFRDYQKDQWDQQFLELLKFKETHGHCHVPHTYKENPALARWAKRQRYQYKRKLEHKQSSMSDPRQQKLEDVGFIWDLQTMVWQERFNELVEYKQRHGDCNVPCRFEENPTLGMWVKCQRRQYKLYRSNQLSRLTPERFQLLANLGFTWEPQASGGGIANNNTKKANNRLDQRR
ncbi:unnamed protein product [Cylindrotheca closterium]|uniref:Helicase-associated domain-containing protein n=1 Tax=Cylindrotheca closterium TaxID=2856 RepID=A0AAD2FKZ2_9STRA|nr:unnamed protein product [Cylindrotheca closterium]